ncbi:MAG: NAD(P)H-binding protein, partial [Phycisphaerae bacterium]|nr:NAD(P)H-binding protein [Phycisphaerae bacterium]
HLRGCTAVIHLVGIIAERPSAGVTFERIHFEGTKSIVDAAAREGIRRFVHMSALGARANAASEYHRTKWKAEEYLRQSGVDWTILRPSLIHGPEGAFLRQAAGWASGRAMPFLFMPYFGRGVLGRGGAGLIPPVFVEDVARAFVDALRNERTIGRSYDLGGPEAMTWPQMYQAIARAVVGRERLKLPIPVWYARLLTCLVPARLLPFNRDQVIMSQEDNVADLSAFVADFGWSPRPFEATLREYVPELATDRSTDA